jgi:acetyl esterase/lipase
VYGEFDFIRRGVEAFKERLSEAKVESRSIVLEGEGHNSIYLVRVNGKTNEPYPDELIP